MSRKVEISRVDPGDPGAGFLRVWIDDANVFEDSPVALVIEMGGPPFGDGDTEQTITCGPVQFTINPTVADASFSLRLSEAEYLRDGLTDLLSRAANSQGNPK